MGIFNRKSLKGFFKRGSNPTQDHFENLIDSSINKIDDGFARSLEDGLKLYPMSKSNVLLSFYSSISSFSQETNAKSDWSICINPEEFAKGISFRQAGVNDNLFLQNEGNVGVGTLYPRALLDVHGTLISDTRIGGFKKGMVPANGQWQTLVDNLNGCQGFEIMANITGPKGFDKYTIAHGVAVCAHGKKGKIKLTQSNTGLFFKQLKFRWKSSEDSFRLEVRSRNNMGFDEQGGVKIKYHVTRLWDDEVNYEVKQ